MSCTSGFPLVVSPVRSTNSSPIPQYGSNSEYEDAIERFRVMAQQENDKYHIQSTSTIPPIDTKHLCSYEVIHDDDDVSEDHHEMTVLDIVDCRHKVAIWCYDLVYYCNMNTETVELALSCLDRFMFTQARKIDHEIESVRYATWTDPSMYQLAAMTAFYLAVKIQEPSAFNPTIVATKLSRGTYTVAQIERMERYMINYVQWHLNPPTVTAIVREYIVLLQPIFASNVTSRPICVLDSYIEQKFQYYILRQIQLCTIEYSLIPIPVYIKAYCAVLNALELLHVSENVLRATDTFLRNLLSPANTNTSSGPNYFTSGETYTIRCTLYRAMMSDCQSMYPVSVSPTTIPVKSSSASSKLLRTHSTSSSSRHSYNDVTTAFSMNEDNIATASNNISNIETAAAAFYYTNDRFHPSSERMHRKRKATGNNQINDRRKNSWYNPQRPHHNYRYHQPILRSASLVSPIDNPLLID